MEYILGPDLNSPLLSLLSIDLSPVDRILLYSEVLLADVENQFSQPDLPSGVGPNCYPTLRDADFFRRCSERIIIECPVVKAGWGNDSGLDGIEPARQTVECINRTVAAGGAIPAITMDEPYTAIKPANAPLIMSYDTCTDRVSRWCETVRAAGVTEIQLTESYPWFRSHDILSWTDTLRKRGLVDALRIDCDHRALKNTHDDRLDMRAIRNQCLSWNMPLSVIVTPVQPHTSAEFLTAATDYVEDAHVGIHPSFEGWPDALYFQSWQGRDLPFILELLDLLVRTRQFVEMHP